MSSETKLRNLTDEATPLLEAGLKGFEIKDFNRHTEPQELQLRMSNCGIATAALQQWLREAHGVESERLIARADLIVDDMAKSRRVSHVVLRTDGGDYVDPTYSQFHAHVGLTHRVAVSQELVDLYPSQKIAVFSDPAAFAQGYAASVHNLDAIGVPKQEFEGGTDGAFRGASEEEMSDFYTRLWSPASSEAFPLEEQRPHFQSTARKIADFMLRTKQ